MSRATPAGPWPQSSIKKRTSVEDARNERGHKVRKVLKELRQEEHVQKLDELYDGSDKVPYEKEEVYDDLCYEDDQSLSLEVFGEAAELDLAGEDAEENEVLFFMTPHHDLPITDHVVPPSTVPNFDISHLLLKHSDSNLSIQSDISSSAPSGFDPMAHTHMLLKRADSNFSVHSDISVQSNASRVAAATADELPPFLRNIYGGGSSTPIEYGSLNQLRSQHTEEPHSYHQHNAPGHTMGPALELEKEYHSTTVSLADIHPGRPFHSLSSLSSSTVSNVSSIHSAPLTSTTRTQSQPPPPPSRSSTVATPHSTPSVKADKDSVWWQRKTYVCDFKTTNVELYRWHTTHLKAADQKIMAEARAAAAYASAPADVAAHSRPTTPTTPRSSATDSSSTFPPFHKDTTTAPELGLLRHSASGRLVMPCPAAFAVRSRLSRHTNGKNPLTWTNTASACAGQYTYTDDTGATVGTLGVKGVTWKSPSPKKNGERVKKNTVATAAGGAADPSETQSARRKPFSFERVTFECSWPACKRSFCKRGELQDHVVGLHQVPIPVIVEKRPWKFSAKFTMTPVEDLDSLDWPQHSTGPLSAWVDMSARLREAIKRVMAAKLRRGFIIPTVGDQPQNQQQQQQQQQHQRQQLSLTLSQDSSSTLSSVSGTSILADDDDEVKFENTTVNMTTTTTPDMESRLVAFVDALDMGQLETEWKRVVREHAGDEEDGASDDASRPVFGQKTLPENSQRAAAAAAAAGAATPTRPATPTPAARDGADTPTPEPLSPNSKLRNHARSLAAGTRPTPAVTTYEIDPQQVPYPTFGEIVCELRRTEMEQTHSTLASITSGRFISSASRILDMRHIVEEWCAEHIAEQCVLFMAVAREAEARRLGLANFGALPIGHQTVAGATTTLLGHGVSVNVNASINAKKKKTSATRNLGAALRPADPNQLPFVPSAAAKGGGMAATPVRKPARRRLATASHQGIGKENSDLGGATPDAPATAATPIQQKPPQLPNKSNRARRPRATAETVTRVIAAAAKEREKAAKAAAAAAALAAATSISSAALDENVGCDINLLLDQANSPSSTFNLSTSILSSMAVPSSPCTASVLKYRVDSMPASPAHRNTLFPETPKVTPSLAQRRVGAGVSGAWSLLTPAATPVIGQKPTDGVAKGDETPTAGENGLYSSWKWK
ncbi:hypothetical protein DFJ77DRAFT_543382 [Powellomyces hirtus]|nr:hypothetical protein DFJ77DRAFT_543382 [Powellomyces hirtus]